MARQAERRGISKEEYLSWEPAQDVRHEYFKGEIFAMAGGSVRHNALCSRVNAILHQALAEAGCVVLTSDQRVSLSAGERYVYPDVSVVCGAVTLEDGTSDVLSNPTIVVEVLSESTEQYDRGTKWDGYQRLPSLTDYVLVSQSEARLEHFRRGERGQWVTGRREPASSSNSRTASPSRSTAYSPAPSNSRATPSGTAQRTFLNNAPAPLHLAAPRQSRTARCIAHPMRLHVTSALVVAGAPLDGLPTAECGRSAVTLETVWGFGSAIASNPGESCSDCGNLLCSFAPTVVDAANLTAPVRIRVAGSGSVPEPDLSVAWGEHCELPIP